MRRGPEHAREGNVVLRQGRLHTDPSRQVQDGGAVHAGACRYLRRRGAERARWVRRARLLRGGYRDVDGRLQAVQVVQEGDVGSAGGGAEEGLGDAAWPVWHDGGGVWVHQYGRVIAVVSPCSLWSVVLGLGLKELFLNASPHSTCLVTINIITVLIPPRSNKNLHKGISARVVLSRTRA